jgi:hypothetical protein
VNPTSAAATAGKRVPWSMAWPGSSVVLVDGEVVRELLEPVIGKAGQVRLALQGFNSRWALNDDKHPLAGVRLRPDGLLEITRDDGWDVLDPAIVLVVEWVAREGEGGGAYL